MASIRAIEEKLARDLEAGPRRDGAKKKRKSAKKRSTKSGSASKRRSTTKRSSAKKRATPRRDHVARRPAKRKTAKRGTAKRKSAKRKTAKRSGSRDRASSSRGRSPRMAAMAAGRATVNDDLSYRGKLDDDRINVNQPHEVRYWTKALRVSPATLRGLVAQYGVMAADIRRVIAEKRTFASRDPGKRSSRRGASKRRPLAGGRKRAAKRPAKSRDRGSMTYAAAMRDLGYFGK